MQRGAHFFEKKTFPCSVALKVLGVSSAAARSRIGFSNIFSLRRFCRVASLALWCFIFQYAALSFPQFLASPWVAFLGRRVWSGPVGRGGELLN